MSETIKFKNIFLWLVIVMLSLCSSFWTGKAIASHISGTGYINSGHLTSDGNVNRCHEGSYSAEANYASGTWSSATTTKLNMYYDCTVVELRTKSIDLKVSTPLGYSVICPPTPSVCFDAYNGTGSGANLATIWRYSEAILNSNSSALGGSGSTTNNRRHTFFHEMGHALTSLSHRTESNAVMRSGKLEIIMPNSTEVSLMEGKY